jgi:hypothetical protein
MAREKLQEVVRDGWFILCYERIRNGSVQGALVSRAQAQAHVYSDAASAFSKRRCWSGGRMPKVMYSCASDLLSPTVQSAK